MDVKVFANQTGVRLRLQSFIDFETKPVSSAVIKYIKPDGSAGQWMAVVLEDSIDGSIYFDFTSEEEKCFNQKGWWKLWVEGVYADGRTFEGKRVKYFIDD